MKIGIEQRTVEMKLNVITSCTILLVDDELSVLRSLARILGERYSVVQCTGGIQALDFLSQNSITVVVSDIKMPGMSGIDLIEQIHEILPDVPVILMTGHGEIDTVVRAVRHNVFDFILKPFNPDELFAALDRAIKSRSDIEIERNQNRILQNEVQDKAARLEEAHEMVKDMSMEVLQRLTSAAECRDTETGCHIVRIGQYAHNVAVELGLGDEAILEIASASQMHDIGKIGIPDSILLKPGPLTKEEFEIMKTHTTIGNKILCGSRLRVLKTAALIALTHHEKWDGSGYPRGLKGEEIPLEGRIVLLCDQYDALRSMRPYKPQLTHAEVVHILTKGDGRTMPAHFAPEILDIFKNMDYMFDMIFNCQPPADAKEGGV